MAIDESHHTLFFHLVGCRSAARRLQAIRIRQGDLARKRAMQGIRSGSFIIGQGSAYTIVELLMYDVCVPMNEIKLTLTLLAKQDWYPTSNGMRLVPSN